MLTFPEENFLTETFQEERLPISDFHKGPWGLALLLCGRKPSHLEGDLLGQILAFVFPSLHPPTFRSTLFWMINLEGAPWRSRNRGSVAEG